MNNTVSAVIVSFADPLAACRAIESLLCQSHAPIEVLLVDNHPAAATARAMGEWGFDARVRLVASGENLGYTVACNRAAEEAHGDWLFFLNPDATAAEDCLSMLLQATDERTGVAGAQVLLPDGRTNAGDNPVHITGIAWAGHFGEPRESGAARQVAAVSGAALLARTRAFRELGGMCERFFMYVDDVDLCWRMRLSGWEVLFCPVAVVWHDYEFDKGAAKWFWLERNRVWAVLSNYSLLSLVLLGPLLAGTGLAIAAVALRDGWSRELRRAWVSTLRDFRGLLAWRRVVQTGRRVGDRELVALMCGRFETALLPSPIALRVNPLMVLYRQIVLRILAAAGT